VQGTDNCQDFDSLVLVRDKNDNVVDSAAIPDGGTTAKTFSVPPKGSIAFECSGSGTGKCQYSLVVP
jgi:hypothetical protein